MYQGGSDAFLGPHDDIVCPSADYGIDFESEVAVITADAAMQCSAEAGIASVRLLDTDGQSIFGAIDQRVIRAGGQ